MNKKKNKHFSKLKFMLIWCGAIEIGGIFLFFKKMDLNMLTVPATEIKSCVLVQISIAQCISMSIRSSSNRRIENSLLTLCFVCRCIAFRVRFRKSRCRCAFASFFAFREIAFVVFHIT